MRSPYNIHGLDTGTLLLYSLNHRKPSDLVYMKNFTIPGPFEADTPFNQTHFWQWAKAQPEKRAFRPAEYLQALGFVVGEHKITEDEFDRLRFVCEEYTRSMPLLGWEPIELAELLTASTSETAYYVHGLESRAFPSQTVASALVASGWVYAVRPSSTYFEIINGALFAKYQSILGSRKIAKIKR